jgi:hypothetical protein
VRGTSAIVDDAVAVITAVGIAVGVDAVTGGAV